VFGDVNFYDHHIVISPMILTEQPNQNHPVDLPYIPSTFLVRTHFTYITTGYSNMPSQFYQCKKVFYIVRAGYM
jgi:hypothetical protein